MNPGNILRLSPLFQVLSSDLIDTVAEQCHRETFGPGAEIFGAGEIAQYLYVLERGNVALVILTEAREEVIFSTVTTPGEILAWSALVEPRVLTASAECLSETVLLFLEANKLQSLLEAYPYQGLIFMRRLASLIAMRLKDTQRRLMGSIS
jgi:CRP-like cAMP-binding protein